MNLCNTGIYLITHIASGRHYIGMTCAKNGFVGRWDTHRKNLRKGKHSSPHLLAAWILYGEKAFKFSVHSYIEQGNLPYDQFRKMVAIIENKLIQQYPDNFNHTTALDGCMVHLPEVKAKIRAANLKKMKNPKYKARKVAEINSKQATVARTKSNKSKRIRELRRVQMTEQMANNPKLKAARLKGIQSTESQQKASIGKAAKWADPKWAKKMKKILKASTNRSEVRTKQSNSLKALWADPVQRAKRMEINKRAGTTRRANNLAKKSKDG